MLCTYELKVFEEQLKKLKVYDYGITTMEEFADKTTYITIKNNHTWICIVYILDEILQEKIYGLPKWEAH